MNLSTDIFVIYDDNGVITDKVNAHCKSLDTLPDLSKRWILKHVNGELDSHLYFPHETNITREDCFIDPTAELPYKIKEGCEEEFEFFMKHGYHKVGD